VPAILNEAVPATTTNVDGEIQGTLRSAYKYTGKRYFCQILQFYVFCAFIEMLSRLSKKISIMLICPFCKIFYGRKKNQFPTKLDPENISL